MGRNASTFTAVALAVWALVGCRQENPDWRGPVAGTADSSDPSVGDPTGPDASTGEPFTCEDPELTPCSFECVDTQSNDNHCGGCGNDCVGNRTCVDGNCEK